MTGRHRTLVVTEHDGVAIVTLNRPAERNAIDSTMIAELHTVCSDLETQPRIAILTGGSDGAFAAGADISQLRDRGREDALDGINLNLFSRIRSLPLPTIAAIDGYAIGGGAELSYACDIRIATYRTIFGQPEPQLGIIAGAGAAFRLVRLLGESVAKHILLAGENIDAKKALALGLVHSVVDPDELLSAAMTVAMAMRRSSPIALRMTKLAVDAPESAHPQIDLAIQAMLFTDEEKYRRMDAFLAKRSRPS
jgi:enoyl-CoA hydratase